MHIKLLSNTDIKEEKSIVIDRSILNQVQGISVNGVAIVFSEVTEEVEVINCVVTQKSDSETKKTKRRTSTKPVDGSALRKRRLRSGMTKKRLAKKLNISLSSLSRAESGCPLSEKLQDKIRRYLQS